MALGDHVEQITRVLVSMHADGLARGLRQQRGLSASQVGKLCGASASQVTSWETGLVVPPVNQALTWLVALHEAAPGPVTALARAAAAEAEAKAAEPATAAKTVDW